MGLEKISDKSTGFLLLLLIVLGLFSLKLLDLRPGSDDLPCPYPLFVQVDGDVCDPGVYSFCSTPKVQDLIDKAGGLKGQGSVLHLPTAGSLCSGAKVVFASDGKTISVIQSEMSAFYKVTLGIPLSLNKESEEGLTAIPGIGVILAKAIVDERTRRGGFRDLEGLKDVPGIGPTLYARISPYLSIETGSVRP